MASGYRNLLIRTFLTFSLVSVASSSKLNVPRVLLPVFDEYSLNFTLETTDGGCYKWSTTRIDIIQLTLQDVDEDLDCSMKASVTSITKEQSRNIAVVFAEDVYTKQVLRCDVIVDVIDSLTVLSRTREIFMEEAPEAFDVRAFDSQGNEFTTLQGVELDWSLVTSGPNKDASVVRFTTFKESPYEIPETIKDIEEQGKKGHIVLLEGVKTGSAKVLVKLPQKQYATVAVHEVQLAVVANLIISPADVYIMAGDYLTFKIIHLNNGQMEEVPMPHTQYYLDVENHDVASANIQSGEVTGLKVGKTRVILHDRNVDESEPGLKLPSANLNVVQPAYMSLNILPHKNWAILLAEHHEIVAEVYSSNDHKLYLGPGVEVHTQVGEAFYVEERSINGSWLQGWAKLEGTAPVQASLENIVHPKLGHYKVNPPLVAKNEILIFPRILLNPSEVILPWDPMTRPKYEIDIVASGGDGKFLWSSSNQSIGLVSQGGRVRTHNMGYFEVSAAIQRNHHNRQHAKIHILPPTRLEIIEYVMEAEVGSTIHLHVALYGVRPTKDGHSAAEVPFTKCQELPFKVKTSDPNFYHNKSDIISPVGISCANVAIISKHVGTSKVTISYGREGQLPIPLEDSVTVNTFKPLKLVHPTTQEIVLAVGTTLHLVFSGGPRPPLTHSNAETTRTLTVAQNETVEAYDVTDAYPGESDRSVLRVLCRKLGESEVTLSVSNAPPVPNCVNKESLVKVRVICGKPRAVYIQPEIKVANVESCPMELGSDRLVIQSNTDVELNVHVLDEIGRRFLNITSLKFKWALTPTDLGLLHSKDSTFQRLYDLGGGLIYGNTSYQLMTSNATAGTIEIKSTVIGYHEKILAYFKIRPEWPEFLGEEEKHTPLPEISTTVKLYLVEDAIVLPETLAIYNHPGNSKKITVQQGSGYFEIALSSDDVADVKFLESSREIEITPLKDGEVRLALVDLCLVSKPAIVVVNVVSVSLMRVEMSDKVEIGKCIPCVVRLYDDGDNLLTIADLEMLNVRASFADDIATIQRDERSELESEGAFAGEIRYVITGSELGDTKITFSIVGADPDITSTPLDLQVFPPLKLIPRNGTILIGASLQYTSKGGPSPDATIEYTTNTQSIANVGSNGLARGLSIGHTRISARAVGMNPTTGQRIIYSEDAVDLNVIPVRGVKISAPLARFRIGSTVPMWASGLPEQISPLILGTVEPAFQFHWTVDDPEIAEIRSVFQDTGVVYAEEDQVSVRVVGLQKGKTKVHLVMTVSGKAANCDADTLDFKHSLDIEVFESLDLISPLGVTGHSVLMAPYSNLQFETNMDSTAKLQYALPRNDDGSDTKVQKMGTSSLEPVISVTESGLLKSYGTFGYAMVLIVATDEHGLKQTLNVIVEVKPVHYMMLNVLANWRIGCGVQCPQIGVVPSGVEFDVVTTYHDNTGREFTAGSVDLKARSSRFDLVRIRSGPDNRTFAVSTKKAGHTVLKVWADGNRKTADYVKIHADQTIYPFVDHFTTGDIVCFNTPLRHKDMQQGMWTSNDQSLLRVDASSGVGKVNGVRDGVVLVQHSLHPASPLHLKVLPVDRVALYPTKSRSITNAPGVVNVVRVVLEDENSVSKKSNVFGFEECQKFEQDFEKLIGEPPFTCYISFSNKTVNFDPLDVFTIDQAFNRETGMYSCNVKAGPKSGSEVSVLKTNISVWAVVEDTYIASEPLELEFVPSIYVKDELELEDGTFTGTLQIVGLGNILKQVSVTPVDASLLQVYEPIYTGSNIRKHEIRLLDYHWKLEELGDPISIIVASKMTHQNIKIRVKVPGASKFDREQCSAGRTSAILMFFINYRHTLTIIVSMIVIFLVTFYAYSRYVQPVINVNVNPNRSLLGGTATPQQFRTSSLGGSPVSPVFCQNISCGDNLSSSFNQSSPVSRNSSGFGTNEPIYGDPSSFYCTSPEVRRNRRYM